jgi:hypothetical protein
MVNVSTYKSKIPLPFITTFEEFSKFKKFHPWGFGLEKDKTKAFICLHIIPIELYPKPK